MPTREQLIRRGEMLMKAGGPYIGPRGGKWADPQHTIPYSESEGQHKGPIRWSKTENGYEARDGKIKIRKQGKKWEMVYYGKVYPITAKKPSMDHAEGLIQKLES